MTSIPTSHDLALSAGEKNVPTNAATLRQDAQGLVLVGNGMELRGDFTRMLRRLKPNNLSRELLVRAAKVKGVDRPRAIDATAGLGEDSLLLAAAGFEVTLYERDQVIAALLRDAMERAVGVPELAGPVSRMRLVEGDSIAALRALADVADDERPDVVLLDPMFPERQKSASVKKKMQLIQTLECPSTDEAEMLEAALAARPRKVVIKRPVKGALLAGRKPSYTISGKAVRYDCIALPR